MRKLFHTLFVLGGGILLAGNLAGCSSDKTDEPNNNGPETTATATISNEPAGATSVKLTLTTSGISEYAWQIAEGNVTTAPKAEFIFSDGRDNGQYATAKDGDNIIDVKGLEGNKEYTIFVATKSSQGYEVKDVHITTKDYTQTVTIVDIKQFSMSFHVKIEAGKYYRWSLYQKDNYDTFKRDYGWMDSDLLSMGQRDVFTGEQTFALVNGKKLDGEDPAEGEEELAMEFKVGTAYILLLGECDAEGNILYESGGEPDWGDDLLSLSTRSAYPDSCIGDYTETCNDEVGTCTGIYAKYNFWAAPATQGPSEVTVKMTEKTAKHVTFHLTPTEDMIGYAYATFPVSLWEELVELYGESGAQAWLTGNYALETGELDVVADDLVVGDKYMLVILSTFSQDYSVQTLQKIEFEALNSTQALAEVVVTGIDAPKDATQTGPYYVWFNVKAPNKDVGAAKYSCEYTKNWVSTINAGETTVDELLNKYGVSLSAENVEAINSDAGLNLSFDSWENTPSRLYILAYNTDEVGKITYGESTSPEEPAKTRVESTLFSDLLGDWTATYKSAMAKNGATIKVTIAASPESPEMSAKEEQALVEYYQKIKELSEADAKKLVAQEYKNYQDRAKRFGEKYREQNRLVCRGFEYADPTNSYFEKYYKLGYYSPWDLFCNLSYSAYSTDDLFYDYGSKWFLEIGKDGDKDIVKVATNSTYVAPMQNMDKEYRLGYTVTGNAYAHQTCDYPVTISEDKNTITIEAYPDGETLLYPGLISFSAQTGTVSSVAKYTDVIILTRGWTDPTPATSAAGKSLDKANMPKVVNGVNNHYRRTKLFAGTPCRTITISPTTELPVSKQVSDMAARVKKNNR